jgi:hypothetical protein
MLAPALHVDAKSRFGPCDEARFVARVMQAARGVEVPLPMVFGRRHLGHAIGSHLLPYVWRTRERTLEAAGFPTLESVVIAARAGQGWSQYWFKTNAGAGQGVWLDMYGAPGSPISGTYTGTALTARPRDNTDPAAIWQGTPASPMQKHLSYCTMVALNAAASTGVAILYDRVLVYDNCTFTGALQSFINSSPAARYISAGQPGLQVMLTCQAIFANTALTMTALSYTNQAGSSGHSPLLVSPNTSFATPTSTSQAGASGSPAVLIYPQSGGAISTFLPLQAGDTGVTQLDSFTTSQTNTGKMCVVLCRPLAYTMVPVQGTQFETDQILHVLNPARVYDDACLSVVAYCGNNTNLGNVQGRVDTVWA